VVDHQVDEHADAATVSFVYELDEVAERAEPRVDPVVIGDVVAVVSVRRRLDRRQPQRVNA
jgi:hypothetical protein